ncbi:MAG: IclR family transcriptional regulator [Phototrophicaceae bacterium]
MSKSRAAIRTIKILELVAEHDNGLTMSEIANELDIPVTSVNDIVKALLEMEMLHLIDTRSKTYGIGLKAFYIGNTYIHNTSLLDRAKPIVKELGALLNKTVFIGKHANGKITYLHKHEAPGVLIATCSIGSQATMHNTALGKSILAYDLDALDKISRKPLKQETKNTITDFDELRRDLEQVRELGYAIDNGEHNEHLFCIGAPIFDSSGHVVAALSVSSLDTAKLNVETEALLIREKAKEISLTMGWRETVAI